MAKVTPTQLIQRLRLRTAALAPDSPEMRAAMVRIGLVVTSQTKTNIRRRRLIDTGRLLNSIRYEHFRNGDTVGIRVGSWGVPYAAVHEFGFNGTVRVNGHWRMAPGGRQVRVTEHNRATRIRARPYLRPAVKQHAKLMVELIARVFREAVR